MKIRDGDARNLLLAYIFLLPPFHFLFFRMLRVRRVDAILTG